MPFTEEKRQAASLLERGRVAPHGRRPAQRQVLYLGEINDSQELAWRKSIEVFDEEKQDYRQISLSPSDRPIPADEANALSLVLTEMRLLRPRSFGDCWLSCLLWEELGLQLPPQPPPRIRSGQIELPASGRR
jgi:hypothetical protein